MAAVNYDEMEITRKMILDHFVFVLEHFAVDEIVPYFIQSGLMTMDDDQEINMGSTLKKKNKNFIYKMFRCGPDSFRILRESLIRCKRTFILDQLQKPAELVGKEPRPCSPETGVRCPNCNSWISDLDIYTDASSIEPRSVEESGEEFLLEREDSPGVSESLGEEHVYEVLQTKPEERSFRDPQAATQKWPETETVSLGFDVTDGPSKASSSSSNLTQADAKPLPPFDDGLPDGCTKRTKTYHLENPLNIAGSGSGTGNPRQGKFKDYNRMLKDIEGWCPTVFTKSEMNKKLTGFTGKNHSYVVWYSSEAEAIVLTLLTDTGTKHLRIKEKSAKAGAGIQFYLFSGQEVFASIHELLTHYIQEGVEMKD